MEGNSNKRIVNFISEKTNDDLIKILLLYFQLIILASVLIFMTL